MYTLMSTFMDYRQAAQHVVKTLDQAGHIAYFTGGWVRDFIINHPSDDIDIATSANVEEIQKLFSKTIPIGISFGIVIVIIDIHQFEVATFRQDHNYIDGRRPTSITQASPQEDAQRRDFTINGLFYDPLNDKIFDYVNGIEDIQKGILRAIGNPLERFKEDKLRMIRAVRYSTRFGFPIHSDTVKAILTLSSSLLPSVAIERIWQEFKKMSQFDYFDKALVTLHQLNLLPTIFPQLKAISVEQIQDQVKYISLFPKETPTIGELLELFPYFSIEDVNHLCDGLKLSNDDRSFTHFYLYAKRHITSPLNWKKKLEAFEWAYFYAHPQSKIVLAMIASHFEPIIRENFLVEHKNYQAELGKAILRIQTHKPLVRAEHLMAEGIKPGKQLGFLIKEAEKIAINQNIEDYSIVINILKENYIL